MFQDSGFIATVSIRHFSVNKLLSAPHKFFRGRGFPVQAESCSTHTHTKYPLRASGRSRPRGVRHELPHPPSPCAHKIGAHSPQTATRGGSLCAAFAASITRSPATLRHRAASGRSFTSSSEIAGIWCGCCRRHPTGALCLFGCYRNAIDLFDTADVRTTAASGVFKDRIPAEDAEVVRRLKAAGAVLLGKTNMHEFAFGGTSLVSYFGAVHSPWELSHIADSSDVTRSRSR